jgi:hypothetical protein
MKTFCDGSNAKTEDKSTKGPLANKREEHQMSRKQTAKSNGPARSKRKAGGVTGRPAVVTDEPLSDQLRAQVRAFQIFAQRLDTAATETLKVSYLRFAGALFYEMNDALEDLGKSVGFPIANGIFDAAKAVLGRAVENAQDESELYQGPKRPPVSFIAYGPRVGTSYTEDEDAKVYADWRRRYFPKREPPPLAVRKEVAARAVALAAKGKKGARGALARAQAAGMVTADLANAVK